MLKYLYYYIQGSLELNVNTVICLLIPLIGSHGRHVD